ncbi:polysaccharide pyruvyl transferase family protein [Paracoccus aerodenitrificans]|uniref:polysaccharide pyruvyl transferase family protein n=1 Tax=Paracoccus aerodenitrificans TaxID=3017781 RepID=UPI0022F1183D|nr:polysaccharide pyruvyl transferase family protein [Paracoccus aerodenitrificans]WBU64318.1 polysaccharide pyruvyl transferase family protein [Paracoccus aerodenitrificans]
MISTPYHKSEKPPRALLVGHFSTVGDIEVLLQVQQRLDALGMAYDVSPYTDICLSIDDSWLDKYLLEPERYTHLIVICGPFTQEIAARNDSIFGRFQHCVHIGVNLTMVQSIHDFNPFDILLERDSDRTVRADLSFCENSPSIPVVGLCLASAQREYGERRRGDLAAEKLRRLIRNAGAAYIELDTSVPVEKNRFGISNGAEFEAICRRVDVMLTNRLHGMVLSLKNGIPVIAIDPVAGGDKVTRQARKIGWNQIFDAEKVTDTELAAALQYSLSQEAREIAASVKDTAIRSLSGFDALFAEALNIPARPELRADLVPQDSWSRKLRKRFKIWRRARRKRNENRKESASTK